MNTDVSDTGAVAGSPIMLTKAALKERGWTEAGIKRFLREPDETRQNPKYSGAAPMCLYLTRRVEAAEATPEYVEWQGEAERRKKAAKDAVWNKKQALLAVVRAWKPSFPVLPYDELLGRAIADYNAHRRERALGSSSERDWSWRPATRASDEAFLHRIVVNYCRHVLTNYDDLLAELHGRVGINEAIDLVRDNVYEVIAQAYPVLAAECDNQRRARQTFVRS